MAGYSKKLDSPLSPNLHGWSSRQNPRSITSETPCEKLQAPYVHPSTKQASWWMSEKSLNLCTENLGSETGSEFIEKSIFSPPNCSTTENNNNKIGVKREPRSRQVPEAKKQFPPPLTTLGGPECIDIRPQRDDGRLILKATRTNPARQSVFRVDRSNGRLRLSLADSRKEEDEKVTSDQIVTNKEGEYDMNEKLETNYPERAACSSYDYGEVERAEIEKLLNQQRRSGATSCCRYNESHKNNEKKNAKRLMIAKMEPHFLVASS